LTIRGFYVTYPEIPLIKETGMAFKEYDHKPSFLEIELNNVMGKSRTQKFLSEVDSYIDWKPLESIVTSNYPVGQSDYGNKAYPPLMLLKATLLQKWFGIKSDPELENQVNDLISFKTFIGLPLVDPSPDHSVICRFRERVGKDTLEDIHHELLYQFDSLGFSIESGMAVDARIIKSASRPVPGKKLKVLREKRKARAQQRKKTRQSMRFQRDLDSDWTVKNKQPVFGMKEHAAIDVKSGLALSTQIENRKSWQLYEDRYMSSYRTAPLWRHKGSKLNVKERF
jgi:IS5 family transposase